MPGPTPKPAALRQRRNKSTTAATLPTQAVASGFIVPPMPERTRDDARTRRGSRTVTSGDRGVTTSETTGFESDTAEWHPNVVSWWTSVWTSPMAQEYAEADRVGGLALLAELWHRWWTESDTRVLATLSTTINQVSRDFGLSPMARRSLQWQIDQGEKADERTQKRRQAREPITAGAAKDPRRGLRLA